MRKLDVGDHVIFNIKGFNRLNDGSIMYEIDPLKDGTPRFVSEKKMREIIESGGDVYHRYIQYDARSEVDA